MQSFISPEMSIELQPEYPKPGEIVTASINDYSGGVYGSEITWLFNGQEIPDAKNQRNTEITAGPAGTEQLVEVILTKPTGGKKILRTVIRPAYLDIIVEPQTRVPDFYLGRGLPSIGSVINATAIVSTDKIRRDSLVFTWQLNNKVLEGGPLRGGNKVSFATPMGEDMILSVLVTELDGSVITRRAILVPSVNPSIQFYEVSSLFGLNQRPITAAGLTLSGESTTVRAEPYNLDSRVYNNADVNQWSVEGVVSPTGSGGNPYELSIQRTGISGKTSIGFHVRDLTQVLQGAESNFQVNH
tara:strand:- start:539 stop:1438 length:900 start_codon:yes stop_codon:yes gene_type:complete